ncbi:hypothetical protein DXT76_20165 [Halobacillus trueperi]|uniref:DUF3953 domain-containing protein n=1 Tax=Halobacillus trueperi TaxID=156205 RepID=A0A3D8VCI5_9BACI|nr:hypothetical protein [Halobacillus trueperi]RDY66969.1 hypothetical protein DXT76_20165 [Halobacillus trueperi]
MKLFRIFNALYGAVALIWLTVSLFHEGFNPSVKINAGIIGGLFLLLGVDDWMDDRKKYAAYYFFLAVVSMIAVMI